MPITVKLNEKKAGGAWSASGFLTGTQIPEPILMECLVNVEGQTVQLILDSSVLVSRLDGRKILHYSNAKPVTLEAKAKKGTEITFPSPIYVSTENVKK